MYTFKNKSENLRMLDNVLKKSFILPQCSFSVREYRDGKTTEKKILKFCEEDKAYIVRSSSAKEDSYESSAAGKYLSVPNLSGYENILNGVECVIASFGDEVADEDIVFIQPMLENISICGVLFTIDPNNMSEYYVVNYDRSGQSDAVTSGVSGRLETYYLYRGEMPKDEEKKHLITAVKEIEEIFAGIPLDIEFAVTNKGEVCIFQVRPLVIKGDISRNEDTGVVLKKAYEFVKKGMAPKPFLYGKRTIYGVMPDWNPAEIIGEKPRPLALSVYRYLVTDDIWAYQRDNYGNKNMRSNPLMINIAGIPYIDSRVSFNSFIPNNIDEDLSSRLVDYYLDRLEKNPFQHDKIEFSIVYSANSFDLDIRLKELLCNGFSEEDISIIEKELILLTNKIIDTEGGLWVQDIEKIKVLEKRHEMIMNSNLDDISKIYWLLEDCCRYGTLPFAGLARAGFIAVQMLKSLVSVGILTQKEYDLYLKSVNTVSKQLARDRNDLSKEDFIKKYGHLRPGTYDITMDRYDKNPVKYFEDTSVKKRAKREEKDFSLSLSQYRDIEILMKKRGFDKTVLELFEFIREAIEWREYSKFIFTRNVSDAFELINEVGNKEGFTRDEISYLDIFDVKEWYMSSWSIKDSIRQSVEKGKNRYKETLKINLPPLIVKERDVYEYTLTGDFANFITLKSVDGDLVENLSEDINNKIVLIEAADPGYDWIFTYKIKGLITKCGGANSHMAIRASELNLPAAIGVGEIKYNYIKRAKCIKLDCSNKKISVIR